MPEVVQAVESGKMTVKAAHALAKLPPDEQRKALAAGKQEVKQAVQGIQMVGKVGKKVRRKDMTPQVSHNLHRSCILLQQAQRPVRCRLCAELGSTSANSARNHRLAAVKTLGHEHIDAYVIARDVLDIEVELIEIDENLCRADLTAAQRADSVARRARIWEALQPVEPLPELGQAAAREANSAQNPTKPKKELGGAICATHLDSIGRKKSPQQSKAFAAETAALTGETKSTINRQLARAAALGDDIKAVVGTSLDKGVELDALKDLPVPERKALIARAKAGEKVSARLKSSRGVRQQPIARPAFRGDRHARTGQALTQPMYGDF